MIAVVRPDGSATITLGEHVHEVPTTDPTEAIDTVLSLVSAEARITARPLESAGPARQRRRHHPVRRRGRHSRRGPRTSDRACSRRPGTAPRPAA
ncbi:hypothetical protein G5V59_27345 [Nocardioides sp. W3-2-3]|uniref:hypothetical protein n=1 Tax=Nocardioides convexus TaxID=2712224 RepID=UPI002418B7B1|nr:hypothetical protein [Nocardioides convexus]NHA02098.1 hypothetical protein [Nocardioides convexus]